ncbi:LamG domain-containing protein [Streptomyces sp. NBC_00388]|uniref:LamG domain-containing protein n=1 Tax=Streptomyces sp. NBC_00388 TaxID=2975735 RepID=UPI002E215BA2
MRTRAAWLVGAALLAQAATGFAASPALAGTGSATHASHSAGRARAALALDAPSVTSTDYPECGQGSCASHGGIGVPGVFTVTTTSADIVKLTYTLNGSRQQTRTVPAGTTSTALTLTPDQLGVNVLEVAAWDAAGHTSPSRAYDFSVAQGAPQTGNWSFDEGSGATAADSAGAHPAALMGGAGWSGQARLGKALTTDGTKGYATVAGAGPDTSASFTVSGWARLTGTSHNAVVAAQAGVHGSAFALYYSASYKAWVFNRSASDSATPTLVRSVSTATPATGVWTHLTGVYDASARTIQLYVNGAPQGQPVAVTTPWKAGGGLQIGRGQYGGAFTDYFPGQLDEIRTWARALGPDEIAGLEAEDDPETGQPRPALAADWELDEPSGTTGADSSGYGHPATLSSGSSFATDNDGGKGGVLSLDGAKGYATAHGPLVDAQGDFTIAAWVRLDPAALSDTSKSHTMRIAGQGGTSRDSWGLWYTQASGLSQGMWVFGRTSKDTAGATTVTDPVSIESARLVDPRGAWTMITGTYDSAHRQLQLYVNGVRQNDGVTFDSPWQATGDFSVGRGRLPGGGYGDAAAGLVDGVRVWTGLVGAPDINQLYLNEVPVPL